MAQSCGPLCSCTGLVYAGSLCRDLTVVERMALEELLLSLQMLELTEKAREILRREDTGDTSDIGVSRLLRKLEMRTDVVPLCNSIASVLQGVLQGTAAEQQVEESNSSTHPGSLEGPSRTTSLASSAPMCHVATLLSARDGHLLMFLLEAARYPEEVMPVYANATSIRTLAVMWSLSQQQQQQPAAEYHYPHPHHPHHPSPAAVQQVLERMAQSGRPIDLCDVSLLVMMCLAEPSLTPVTMSAVQRFLTMGKEKQQSTTTAGATPPISFATEVEWVGVGMAMVKLLSSIQSLLLMAQPADEVVSDDGHSSSSSTNDGRGTSSNSPPPYVGFTCAVVDRSMEDLCMTVSFFSAVMSTTSSSPVAVVAAHLRQAFLDLLTAWEPSSSATSHYVTTQLGGAAAANGPLSATTALSHVVTWLLKEFPQSSACLRHFSHLASVSPSQAFALLRRNRLLSTESAADLAAISKFLLPLLIRANNVDLLVRLVGEVLTQLEGRLHSSSSSASGSSSSLSSSWSAEELDELARFGTVLFSAGGNEALEERANDVFRTFGSQLEEIDVMAGSAVSLIRAMVKWCWHTLTPDLRQYWDTTTTSHTGMTPTAANEQGSTSSRTTTTTSMNALAQQDSSDMPAEGVVSLWAPLRATRQRFLLIVDHLVQSFVASHQPIVSPALHAFIRDFVPVPNLQREYQRKIFLLVNVTDEKEVDPYVLRSRSEEDSVPQELRLLVSSLPHTLSPYASVAILREVLAKSAGNNPRYTYVCRAAVDLQLPISTTRSRIATAMNMWSFLRTQSGKLSTKQWLLMQKRCLVNFPLSYAWSSYWALLWWVFVTVLLAMHFFGRDYESSVLCRRCLSQFGVPPELCPEEEVVKGTGGSSSEGDAEKLERWVRDGLREADCHDKPENDARWLSAVPLLSRLFTERQKTRRLFVLKPSADSRHGMQLVKRLCEASSSPFYLDLYRPYPLEKVEAKVAERMRRVSLFHARVWMRPVVRFFPLGLRSTEVGLIKHSCHRAARRSQPFTFIFYVPPSAGVPLELLRAMFTRAAWLTSSDCIVVTHSSSFCTDVKGSLISRRDLERRVGCEVVLLGDDDYTNHADPDPLLSKRILVEARGFLGRQLHLPMVVGGVARSQALHHMAAVRRCVTEAFAKQHDIMEGVASQARSLGALMARSLAALCSPSFTG